MQIDISGQHPGGAGTATRAVGPEGIRSSATRRFRRGRVLTPGGGGAARSSRPLLARHGRA
jgi:hypothetical protein